MPSTDIVRKIGEGVTERMVRFRIKRLQEEGVINIVAILEPEAVDYNVRADVWISVEGANVMEVARNLAKFEQVTYVACSTGDWDISIQIVGRNNYEIHRFVIEVINELSGVSKTNLIILPAVLKDIHDWRIPEKIAES